MRKLENAQQKELLGFVSLALLFVFPIIQANITFLDDTFRVIVGYGGWDSIGRPLATVSSYLGSLAWTEKGILDTGALGQIMAAGLLALSAFVFNQYLKREFQTGIFWLSAILVINPYFLINLSYRFDALAMALGVLCTVYAFNLEVRDRFGWPKSIILLITAASLYQSDVNLFIALAAIELLLLSQQKNISILIRQLIIRATQYCVALIVYYFTIAKIYMADHHGRDRLVSLDADGLQNLLDNIQHYFSTMQDFFSPPICILLAIFSLYVLTYYLRYSLKQSHRAILLTTPFIAAAMYFISLAGPMVLLAENTASYRTMPSFFFFIALLITLSYIGRNQFSYAWLIPVFITLVISYQYGIVLKTQRDFDESIFAMAHKDLLDAKLDNNATYVSGRLERAPRTINIIESNAFIRKATAPAGDWIARAIFKGVGLKSVVHQWPHEFRNYRPTLEINFCSNTPIEISNNSYYSIYNSAESNLILLGGDLNGFCLEE